MTDEIPGTLTIDVTLDRSINYAMQQNDVPIVKRIRLTNPSDAPAQDVRVRVSSEPEFFPAWESIVRTVPASGTHAIDSIDLRLSPAYLGGLTERVVGHIHTEVLLTGHAPQRRSDPIDVLAFDEWSGLGRSLPELLAAFVMPNHPVVEGILAGAVELLGKATGDSSLTGYAAKSPARVASIVASIYAALDRLNLKYCVPPASFELEGQKIRLPDRILEHRLATCLDLAVLAAGCFEQAGLYPLIIMMQRHAFVGVWLMEECFADCLTDDLTRLRKRIDLNEILVFETTILTNPPPRDFTVARQHARKLLADEEQFVGVIDVHRCRKSRIRPLPVRTAMQPAAEVPGSRDVPIGLFPELEPIATTAPIKETPATRLDRWKKKLLDLSLHNRLINFKQTKSTVPLAIPDVYSLEDALADGVEFQIVPSFVADDKDNPRSAEIHRLRTGKELGKEMLLEELKSRRIYTSLSDDETSHRLLGIYRSAKTTMEEGGASALYLALGVLEWYETAASDQRRFAPIILIPIELSRASAQDDFRVKQSDDEPRINTTLVEMLAKDFGVRLPNMEVLPQDATGIDVRAILSAVRQATKDTPRWDVHDEAHIGFFSFTKFLMWRDLEVRTEELLGNKVVDHLVNRPNEPYPHDGVFPEETRLDESHSPADTFCPLPSDSSQLTAVYAAASDKSFVLFGPPGTGKSQTITNAIAHCLTNGKSVLFVSEKAAALNVVHDRLVKCGLGPFCLELHSNKAKKRHVVDQLGMALDHHGSRSTGKWEREASRIASTRSDLNGFVAALHRPRNFGESAFQATSRLIGLRDARCLDLQLPSPNAVTRDQLDGWREAVQRLQSAGETCGHPAENAWSCCGVEAWSPALQRGVEEGIRALEAATANLVAAAVQVGKALKLGVGPDSRLSVFAFLDELVRFLLAAPEPPAALLLETDWEATEASIGEWLAHGRRRDSLRASVFATYHDRILGLPLEELADRLAKARVRWFLPRFLGTRGVRKALSSTARTRHKRGVDELAADARDALELRKEEKHLADASDRARVLLGHYWKSGEADWDAIETIRTWGGRFRKLARKVAGSNFEKAAELRRHWTGLVTEGRDLLAPSGALGAAFVSYREAYAAFQAAKSGIESRLGGTEGVRWTPAADDASAAEVTDRVRGWRENLTGLRAWCFYREVRRGAVELGLAPLVRAYETEGLPTRELMRVFDRSFYQWWVEWVNEHDPTLGKFFSPEHERKIKQFQELDDRYLRLTSAEVSARLATARPSMAGRVSEASEMGILMRQRQLRRGHAPVRQLFQRIPNLLQRLKPCLLMSPISIAQYLDASHQPFDLVIFDEASQIPVWDAVGAIGRGREVVIVGDPKQLPPTSFFMRADEQELNDDEVVEEMESILDECLSAGLPQLNLRWHYRSRHESLIAFSNSRYYNNELLTFPSPSISQGVQFRYVAGGVYDKGKSRTNRVEAEAVVEEVRRRLRDPLLSRASIGIVTFSMAQQVLIEDLLDEARRKNPTMESYFGDAVPEPVFIKNLENVQGDERDVILFSVCYGPDAQGRVSMNFGPLNRDGGERRLNVAITRAREEVVVFSTLRAEQIDISRTRAQGAIDLKGFLDYAERGPAAMAEAITRQNEDFESPFEKQVCETLRQRGHEVHAQVGCSGYRIDLAVVDPEKVGRYLLGIECDGANYHSAKTARDRDRLRAEILGGLGWRLHRVWSSDWWAGPQDCVAKIEAAIERAKIHRTEKTPRVVVEPEPMEPSLIMPPMLVGADECQNDGVANPESGADSAAVSAYRAFRPKRQLGPPGEFHEPQASPHIRGLIEKVVAEEGPVRIDLVASRVIAHWGMARRGGVIMQRIETLVASCDVKQIPEQEGVFLWPSQADPESYGTFRPPGQAEEDQRAIDEIPPQEIAAAADHVLQHQISLPRADLIRETALLLGFQRSGQIVQRYVSAGVELLLKRGRVREDGAGRIVAVRAD